MKNEGITKASASAPDSHSKGKPGAVETEKKPKSKGGRNYKPKGAGNGGKRDRSGRKEKKERLDKMGVSDTIDQHLVEEVEVIEVNKKTGQKTVSKKPTLQAMLDMLRYEALKKQNITAAKEYLDRTLGRAKQAVEHSGEIITEEEQRLPTKAELAAAEAYLANLEEDDD